MAWSLAAGAVDMPCRGGGVVLLSIVPRLEVLEPADVRERVIAIASKVVARYSDSAPVHAGR